MVNARARRLAQMRGAACVSQTKESQVLCQLAAGNPKPQWSRRSLWWPQKGPKGVPGKLLRELLGGGGGLRGIWESPKAARRSSWGGGGGGWGGSRGGIQCLGFRV